MGGSANAVSQPSLVLLLFPHKTLPLKKQLMATGCLPEDQTMCGALLVLPLPCQQGKTVVKQANRLSIALTDVF